MAARRMKGAWWVDFYFAEKRYRLKSPVDTKRGAEEYERQLRAQILDGSFDKKEVPTFSEWWKGRFWSEWVVARKNKPSEVESKHSIYAHHLEARFGKVHLDEITSAKIAAFRSELVEEGKSEKRINNIMAVLSKPLHYAVDAEVIAKAPKVGMYKVESPEVDFWEFEEYAKLLAAARSEGPWWYVGVCLAGEAGLRVGELRALIWERDVDLLGKTVTIQEQMRHGSTGTPKGRTRRTVPISSTLDAALRSLEVVRRGYVVRNVDGAPMADGQGSHLIRRICRRAGLRMEGWHLLRHSFATHAALFGVNAFRLNKWLGHKTMEETMRYVHVAADHARPIPEPLLLAALNIADPDQRVLAMLGARGHLSGTELEVNRGKEGNL